MQIKLILQKKNIPTDVSRNAAEVIFVNNDNEILFRLRQANTTLAGCITAEDYKLLHNNAPLIASWRSPTLNVENNGTYCSTKHKMADINGFIIQLSKEVYINKLLIYYDTENLKVRTIDVSANKSNITVIQPDEWGFYVISIVIITDTIPLTLYFSLS